MFEENKNLLKFGAEKSIDSKFEANKYFEFKILLYKEF